MAHAILIRAIEPLDNISLMLTRRKREKVNRQLTGGPGVLGKALGITTQLTGTSLVNPNSLIWLEDRGITFSEQKIIVSPRVGIDYAEECADWNWRFRVKDSKWTSPAK